MFDLSGTMWLDANVDESFNGKYFWNGRNSSGDSAGSGMYYYVITNDAGEKNKGKMTIIR